MATYRPDPRRLQVQIDSLRAQTCDDWHCWVVDDGSGAVGVATIQQVLDNDTRFTLVAHPVNVGFYRNFERALAEIPKAAEWVALADQDDVWAPCKLDALLAAAGDEQRVQLVYSDVAIANAAGTVVHPSYWVGRRHNETDLAALLFANTVTGAASVVRRDVLRIALPFPTQHPSSFHDHWLALVARCTGEVRYVDRALHAYVQHEANAIGHQPGRQESTAQLVLRTVRRPWWRRPQPRYYDDEVARLAELADALLVRAPGLAPADRAVLEAVRSLTGPRPARGWLLRQVLAEVQDPGVTMWRRRRIAASVLWTDVERAQARVGRAKASP